MQKKKEPSNRGIKVFLSDIDKLLRSLPTEKEKSEITEHLSVVLTFLNDLKEVVERLPAQEDVLATKESIERLRDRLENTQERPMLSRVLGFRARPSRKPLDVGSREEELDAARSILNKLQELPVDEIRSGLQTNRYSTKQLRAVALIQGISSVGRLSRDSLVHQIITKIANFRGYQRLGESHNHASDGDSSSPDGQE
ncbi:MAG TPA: hypothetical protein VMT62_10125 [Syntrophorhabdaceae bacterium]|nr:hypothetical protein [Syntrophorhabdaceae bacterium]